MKKNYYILLIVISLFCVVNVHAMTESSSKNHNLSCGQILDSATCINTSGCSWGYNGGSELHCYSSVNNANNSSKTCGQILDSATCISTSGCSWGYDSSSELHCYTSSTSTGKETCYNKCEKYGNETAKTECKKSCESQYGTSSSSNSNSNSGIYNGGTSSGINPSQNVGSQTEKVTMSPSDTSELNCDSLFGTNTAVGKYVHDIYNIIKFAVPILLLALSIKEFGAGIISQNENAIRTSISKFGKRLVIAILILVLPTILNFILGFFDIDCFL